MARTRRVVPVSEKIEAKKAESAKVEEKLAKLQNELKELHKNKGVRHCVGIVNKFPERCGKAAFFQNRALIS